MKFAEKYRGIDIMRTMGGGYAFIWTNGKVWNWGTLANCKTKIDELRLERTLQLLERN